MRLIVGLLFIVALIVYNVPSCFGNVAYSDVEMQWTNASLIVELWSNKDGN